MTCTGFGKTPTRAFRTPRKRRMPSGRYKREFGTAQCPDCGGIYATRSQNGRAVLMAHKDKRQCTLKIQRQHSKALKRWLDYESIGFLGDLEPYRAPWFAGEVDQRIDVVETTNVMEAHNFYRQAYQAVQPHLPFRAELRSVTYNPMTYSYIFQFNGQTFAYPNPTVTITAESIVRNTFTNDIVVGSGTTITGADWYGWNNAVNPTRRTYEPTVPFPTVGRTRNFESYYTQPLEDPGIVRERQMQQAEELFRRQEEKRIVEAEASRRAESTLLGFLTPEQAAEYRLRRQFHIRGSRGTLYRILHGSSGNIRQVLTEAEEGRGLHAYCAHPDMTIRDDNGNVLGHLPTADAMISQMLALETDEDAFLAVANRHW